MPFSSRKTERIRTLPLLRGNNLSQVMATADLLLLVQTPAIDRTPQTGG